MSDDPVDDVLRHVLGPQYSAQKSLDDSESLNPGLRRALLRIHAQAGEAPIAFPAPDGAFPSNMLTSIPPVVPDANRLRNDILYACQHDQRTVLVNAANAGLFRLFCAQHVIDEVLEHSQEWASGSGVDHSTFLRRWVMNYLPLIRVIRDSDMHDGLLTATEVERIATLRIVDPDDVPSATLALNLGAFYLSGDRPALEAVYGPGVDLAEHAKWVEVLKAGGDAGELGQMFEVATRLVGGIGLATVRGAQGLWNRTGPLGFLPIGVLGYLLYRRRSPETRAKLRSGGVSFLTGVAEAYGAYQTVLLRFRDAAPAIPTWEEMAETMTPSNVLVRCCLHTLGRVGLSDRSARELRALLPDLPAPHGEAKVREVLRSSGCFTESWTGRWQVGHIALPLRRLLALTSPTRLADPDSGTGDIPPDAIF